MQRCFLDEGTDNYRITDKRKQSTMLQARFEHLIPVNIRILLVQPLWSTNKDYALLWLQQCKEKCVRHSTHSVAQHYNQIWYEWTLTWGTKMLKELAMRVTRIWGIPSAWIQNMQLTTPSFFEVCLCPSRKKTGKLIYMLHILYVIQNHTVMHHSMQILKAVFREIPDLNLNQET